MQAQPVPETTSPTTAVAHLLDVLDDVPNYLFGEDVAAACAMLEKPRAICAHWLMAAVILRASRSGMIWMPLNARWLAGRRAMADLPETTDEWEEFGEGEPIGVAELTRLDLENMPEDVRISILDDARYRPKSGGSLMLTGCRSWRNE